MAYAEEPGGQPSGYRVPQLLLERGANDNDVTARRRLTLGSSQPDDVVEQPLFSVNYGHERIVTRKVAKKS